MSQPEKANRLVLFGPAQLLQGQAPVRLRTKGLALLYLLALDGPVGREQTMDVLWNHGRAASNLRVELHRLRVALGKIGMRAFPPGENPLTLPDGIERDRAPRNGDGEAMQGLDGLSPAFDAWLEVQRTRFSDDPGKTGAALRHELVEHVARGLRQPFVVVLRGLPGAGRSAFAEALAQRLNLPVVRGAVSTSRALHLLEEDVGSAKDVARQILQQPTGAFAILQSSLRRDSDLLLWLRRLYPVDRLRYLDLGALPWHEARELMGTLPFEEAARIYLDSGGNYGYIRELLMLRPPGGYEGRLPLPQRIRAAYVLEANRLDPGPRAALAELSVHPGNLSLVMLERLGLSAHLDELEMAGWLRFRTAWGFCQETARRVIYQNLHPGQRLLIHGRFAEALAKYDPGATIAATYHASQAGSGYVPDAPIGMPGSWIRAVIDGGDDVSTPAQLPTVAVLGGRERAILLDDHANLAFQDHGGWSCWVRSPLEDVLAYADYDLPDVECLLEVRIRLLAESVMGVGLSGDAFPLRLWLRGGAAADRRVIFAPVAAPVLLPDGSQLLPERPPRRVTFICHHRHLRVETRAEIGIIKFQLRVRELGMSRGDPVEAYDLRGPVDQPSERNTAHPVW